MTEEHEMEDTRQARNRGRATEKALSCERAKEAAVERMQQRGRSSGQQKAPRYFRHRTLIKPKNAQGMESGSETNVLTTYLVIQNHPGGSRFCTQRQSARSLIFSLQDHDISSNYVHPSLPALDHASILQPCDKSRPVPRRPSEMLLCNLESRKLNPHTNQFRI